jgi:hypothetical protein
MLLELESREPSQNGSWLLTAYRTSESVIASPMLSVWCSPG